MSKIQINSPLGILEISEENNTIIYIKYIEQFAVIKEDTSYYLSKCISQLNEYFDGKRNSFDLKLNPDGTDFQKEVWKELLKIPYGETRTYQQIANAIGDPGASRAVGNANNKNPIPIIIPCHRVLSSDGKLTGYAGGIHRKEWLLNHERTYSNVEMQLGLF
jgi:methylated-DNA-[protein]-cysteine S-methyltransferase